MSGRNGRWNRPLRPLPAPPAVPALGAHAPLLSISLDPVAVMMLVGSVALALKHPLIVDGSGARLMKRLLDSAIDWLFALPAHQLPASLPHQVVEEWMRWRACTTLPLDVGLAPDPDGPVAPDPAPDPAGLEP